MKGSAPLRSARKGFALACALALTTLATRAHATDGANEGTDDVVARERPSTRSFYGWQILATGEAGGVAAAAAVTLTDSPLKSFASTMGFLVGMPFYVLGGPATHWTHGEFSKGLLSLSGNFVLPVVGGFVGQAVRCAPSDAATDCGTRGFFNGFAIALVTVPVVDALVLGWEDIPDDDPAPPRASQREARTLASASVARRHDTARFTMVPAWSLGPKGQIAVGVSGRF
jgi:hypothetical protein